jgi:2-polyprenyl-3-methyl-5-hydroxy-6-metoxy-1,4-benzoquinol methylase
MDVAQFAEGLTQAELGIYRTARAGMVSYRDELHDLTVELEDRSVWFRHRNDCIAALVARHPPPGALLDVGAGNGFVSARLLADGFDTVLLEPGELGARNARVRRRLPIVLCATLEEAGIRAGAFGGVGAFDVIEHIEHPSEFCDAVARVLSPGGMLYATVPVGAWLWSTADVEAGHFRRYSATSLRTLLERRFDIIQLSYFFRPLVLPLFLFRALPYRLGLRSRPLLQAATEHATHGGFLSRTLSRLLATEVPHVHAGHRLWPGTSCLVAARKRPSP